MHLQSCLHPKKVWNKSLGEYIFVPCRKCAACLNQRSLEFNNLLQQESFHNKFSHFVTLTYNEDCVPTIERVSKSYSKDNILYTGFFPSLPKLKAKSHSKRVLELEDFETPVLRSYDITKIALKGDWNDYDFSILKRQRIPVGCKRDVQLFLKRFRKYVKKEFQASIRYFFVLEYGPKTFRPHYHGIIWHNSEELSKNMSKSIRETWRLGYINSSIARDKASSYVAKYITGTTYLPKIYEISDFSPFYLCSRRPFIGSDSLDSEEVREIVNSSTNVYVRCVNGKPSVVRFSRSFEDRLFPKCRKFGSLSHRDRLAIYGQAQKFFEYSKKIGNDAFQITAYDTLLEECGYKVLKDSPDFLCSFKVLRNCQIFNISLSDYVKRIEDYYNWKDYENLKAQYQFQQDYMSNNTLSPDVKHLIYLYPAYLDKIKLLSKSAELDELDLDVFLSQLSTFGFDVVSLPVTGLPNIYDDYVPKLHDIKEFIDFKAVTFQIIKDSQKTKTLNDVLLFNNRVI